AQLKAAGSLEPLHVRRAQALGDLARSAQTPTPPPLTFPDPDNTDDDKMTEETSDGTDRARWDGKGVAKTGVKIYIHLNNTALRCTCTSATAPNTPAGGTGPPASAFGGTAPPKTARMAADATSDSSSNPAAPGTAPPASPFGGAALGKGLPGGSILEYFIKGPGPRPG